MSLTNFTVLGVKYASFFKLKPSQSANVLYENIRTMEELNNMPPTSEASQDKANKIEILKEKVNVDQAAIDEAREAVGDDEEKIKEYLINNRGL